MIRKNVIGFSVYTGNYSSTLQYLLFSYDADKGFVCDMELDLGSAQMTAKGVYIGDVFYVVNGNTIQSFDLKTYKKIDDLVL